MGTLAQIAFYLIQTAVGFYVLLVLLRFLLQWAKADFYNPLSQFVVKATNPLLRPLRRLVPGLWGIDLAALLLALALQMAGLQLLLLLLGYGWFNPAQLLVWSALAVVNTVVQFYFFAILVSIVFSWVAPGSRHPALMLLYQLNEPIMAPLRRLLPPMGGLDFSPILVFILINVINIVITDLARSSQLPNLLILGM